MVADGVSVTVSTEGGNLVRDVSLDAQPAGVRTWEWDGCRMNGELARPGVCSIVFEAVTEESGTAMSNRSRSG